MRSRPVGRAGWVWLAGAGATLLVGCEGSPSALDPQGPRADRVAILSWIVFGLGTAVFVIVIALFGAALLRARRVRDGVPANAGMRLVVVGGIAVPAIIVTGLMALSVHTGQALSDPDDPPAVTIEVVGHQYWWEVRYPEEEVVTANEIHLPAGEPVLIRLTSTDVIHSFWVPQLAGKIDLIPGQTNTLWIEADQAGRYRGHCAEFCGIQHALMAFHVVAESPGEFDRWIAAMREPAKPASGALAASGRDVFMGLGCQSCHTIQGTEADGGAGPDLTHLMSREQIAAGTLPNTREGLAEFITRAQTVKQGSSMPSFDDLDAASLKALLAYLTQLE